MNSTAKAVLVIAFVVVAFLLLISGGGMGTGIMTGNGWMGGDGWMGGYGMMGNGGMGGFGWMWFPALLLVVIGVALFWAVFGRK